MSNLTTEYSNGFAINSTSSYSERNSASINVMQILQSVIACVGIVANFTVIVVFLNDKKLRRKIPNRFIVNQVRNVHFIYFKSFQPCLKYILVQLSRSRNRTGRKSMYLGYRVKPFTGAFGEGAWTSDTGTFW